MSTKKKSAFLSIALSFALTASLIAGCSGTNSNNNDKAAATPSAPGDPAASAPTGSTPPAPVKLSYWVGLHPDAARVIKNYNETLFYQELKKRTNVSVDFQHPSTGSETEQFNLLIASGNLPDVIEYNFVNYPGGPEKAIADKVIIPLNDYIEQHAPNFKKYLDENPLVAKSISTDSGTIYAFPAVGVGNSNVSSGLMMRKDWLDELGLQAPETIDELTAVLRVFKEKKGVESPLTGTLGDFAGERIGGAFGVTGGFSLNNGKVIYGPYEPAYKDFLIQMNAWYEERLLDRDFATQNAAAKDGKIINGNTGAFFAFIGSGMGKYLNAIPESAPKFDLTAVQHPVLVKGTEPNIFTAAYEYRGSNSAAITPANKNVKRTVEWLDYLFSEEGNVLKSFGVEGITYNMVNGKIQYTDLITNNPDKLSVAEAMGKYLRVASPAPGYVGDDRYLEAFYKYDQQKHATELLNKYYKNVDATRIPQVTQTAEEAQELSAILSEIETYKAEMFLKFVMGVESFDNYDKYIKQLQTMKVERAIELKQAALERFNKR